MIKKYETSEYEVVDIAKLKAKVEQLKTDLAVANLRISKLINAIELKVDKADIINQINISPEGVLIDGKKIHVTEKTVIDNEAIADSAIKSVGANKITSGTIDGTQVNIINVK
ncbi:MAG: hypothetical protein ABF991_03665 [Liquorilactobacillus hordei]|uniref:hypothetical protein n=1 Tax=Liquorilactobacillus hordei TaxID=468911 RepID=UPI0039E859E6